MRPTLSIANATGHCNSCSQDPTYTDTLKVSLVDINGNYVLTTFGLLKTNGEVAFNLGSNLSNNNYYIVVQHRSTIKTWSANLVNFNDSIINYNFSTAAFTTYGSNAKYVNIGRVYACIAVTCTIQTKQLILMILPL